MDFIKKQANQPLWWFIDNAPQDATPEYVLNAEYPTEESVATLPDHLFANPTDRTFPVHTKAAAWMSYVSARGSGDAEQAQQVKAAAAIHGIEEDLKRIDEQFASTVKTASSAEEKIPYALEVDFGEDGRFGAQYTGQHKFYPLDTDARVEDAAVKLANLVNEIPIEWVRGAAANVVKVAKERGVDVEQFPGRVLKWAGEFTYDPENALMVAQERKKLASEDTAPLYEQLVYAVQQNPDELEEALDVWADLDRQNNIKYSSEVPDPYSAAFSGLPQTVVQKLAAESVQCGDYTIPLDDFQETDWKPLAPRMRRQDYNALRSCVKEASESRDCSGLQRYVDSLQPDIRSELVDHMFKAAAPAPSHTEKASKPAIPAPPDLALVSG